MRGTSVLVAGAGLAGLTAARELSRRGATVTVIEARDRAGGRVLTAHHPFLHHQHAELGADLIDESQSEICRLIKDAGLKTARILPAGFTGVTGNRPRRRTAGQRGWFELARRLAPEIRAFRLSERRWDGGVAAHLGRESVARWLDRIRAPRLLREAAIGMRGFFLADPEELSLLALTDQFAEDGVPGGEHMFRIVGGNDRLPATLAKALGSRIHLQTVLRRVRQTGDGITVTMESNGRLQEARCDFLVCSLPAIMLRAVDFDPAIPEPQRQAISALRYGAATKTAMQFDRAGWRARGKPAAWGTPFSIGAVWDGNEEQSASSRGRRAPKPGILTLLAGGGASEATRQILASDGPAGIVRELSWLPLEKSNLLAWMSVSWELERWSHGGYAYFDTQFPPSMRSWLARPFDRVVFAGEHTSMRWQGYMNGAVESGLRAAEEIKMRID
jgi:monoamine oxidase